MEIDGSSPSFLPRVDVRNPTHPTRTAQGWPWDRVHVRKNEPRAKYARGIGRHGKVEDETREKKTPCKETTSTSEWMTLRYFSDHWCIYEASHPHRPSATPEKCYSTMCNACTSVSCNPLGVFVEHMQDLSHRSLYKSLTHCRISSTHGFSYKLTIVGTK